MKADVKQRRRDAIEALLNAAKVIADAFEICPVCLVQVSGNAMRDALADGDVMHFTDRHEGDEGLEGTLQ
jgi:hypothetical protein